MKSKKWFVLLLMITLFVSTGCSKVENKEIIVNQYTDDGNGNTYKIFREIGVLKVKKMLDDIHWEDLNKEISFHPADYQFFYNLQTLT